MKANNLNLLTLLRYSVSLCVVLAMLLPLAAQAMVAISDQECQMMTMDQPEESQKEEQQEDNSKDEKVEMRLLSTHDHLFTTICKRDQIRTVDAALDFILEIPIPPPEQG